MVFCFILVLKNKNLILSLTKGGKKLHNFLKLLLHAWKMRNNINKCILSDYYMHCYTKAKFLQTLSSFSWVTEQRQPGVEEGLGKAFRGHTASFLQNGLDDQHQAELGPQPTPLSEPTASGVHALVPIR